MNIGVIIGSIGGIDGVALEAEKWVEVLRQAGHTVYILTGQYFDHSINPEYETLVPEMSFRSPESFWSQKKAFFLPDTDPSELLDHISFYSKMIQKKITEWIKDKKIGLIISENASALPVHLEMGIAIRNVLQNTGLPAITHDHDFSWERGERFFSPHLQVNRLIEEVFPLRLPNSINVVINTHAKDSLKARFGITAVVIPNVMDFDRPFGQADEKNKNIHSYLGYDINKDILLFQITRIVRRKGIETAIRLLHELKDKNIKLILTGNTDDEEEENYYDHLIDLIHELRMGEQIRFASHLFHTKGLTGDKGESSFSLSDAYARATACTFFSTYEGFGNAFIEAVLARRPVFVNNYQPVFWNDIGSKGFKTVMLENNELTPAKVREMKEIILNKKRAEEITEHNFRLGKLYFSYDILREKLAGVIRQATGSS